MSKSNVKARMTLGLVLAAALGFTPAHAASVAEEVAKLNESIVLLKAQKQALEIQLEIANKQNELRQLGGTSTTNPVADVLPVVRGIEGVDGRFVATLSFGNGMQQRVKAGEKIHGNWTVAQIDVGSVTLLRGSERVRLSFGIDPPPSAAAGGANALPGQPGFINASSPR